MESYMHYIQNLINLLDALERLMGPLKLFTVEALSYIGLVYLLWSLLKKHRL